MATYCFMQKIKKLWPFFWRKVLEISTINSYLLYTQTRRIKITHLNPCRLDFCNADPKNSLTSIAAERLNGLLHISLRDDSGRSKHCLVCSNQKIKDWRRGSRCYGATCLARLALKDTIPCKNMKQSYINMAKLNIFSEILPKNVFK